MAGGYRSGRGPRCREWGRTARWRTPCEQPDPTKVVGRRVVAVAPRRAARARARAPRSLTAELRVPRRRGPRRSSGEEYCDQYLDEDGGVCVDFEDIDDRVYFSDGRDRRRHRRLLGAQLPAPRGAPGLHGVDARQADHGHPGGARGRSPAGLRQGARCAGSSGSSTASRTSSPASPASSWRSAPRATAASATWPPTRSW